MQKTSGHRNDPCGTLEKTILQAALCKSEMVL